MKFDAQKGKVVFKLFFTILFLVFASFYLAERPLAQKSTELASPTPTERQAMQNLMDERDRTSRRLDSLRKTPQSADERRRQARNLNIIRGFYRDLNDEEEKLMAPAPDDLETHKAILKKKNTGLTRLISDKGCSDNGVVVVASFECLQYSMPGGGSSYSFRTEQYRIRRLADLTYSENRFQTLGVLLQGIVVRIGDVPLEKVSKETPGVGFLMDFQPPEDFNEAKAADLEFMNGKTFDGFYYARSAAVLDGETYVLRSIAYKGSVFRAYEGITYDELDFDKRKDLTVAFRVVSRDENGITILWKQLDSRSAPKILLGETAKR